MASFTAYQANAFQSSSFQIVGGAAIGSRGGGGKVHDYTNSYEQSRWKYEKDQLEKQAKAKESQIKSKNKQIDHIEDLRLQDLKNTKLQLELVKLAKEAEAERQLLLDIQAKIAEIEAFWRREEDDLLALLYCLPFC